MLVITKADLVRFRKEAIERGRRAIIDDIVRQVKDKAERGQHKYAHQYQGGWEQYFTPEEIVQELRSIFIDIHVDYAEPYVSIRW
jgi:hypothetical protein